MSRIILWAYNNLSNDILFTLKTDINEGGWHIVHQTEIYWSKEILVFFFISIKTDYRLRLQFICALTVGEKIIMRKFPYLYI